MDNNKLIQLLQTFTKKEWRDFSKFVESPYFNTDKQCGQLLDVLKKELSRDSNYMLSRERLERQFQKVVGKGNAQLNAKLSNLTRLAERFLASEKLDNRPLIYKHLLLNNLFERGLGNHFERVHKKDIAFQKSPKKVSMEFYRDKLSVEYDFLEYITEIRGKMYVRENIQEVNDTLDIHYILTKINIFTKILPFKNMYEKEFDTSSFDVLESLIQLPRFANHPVLRIYYTAFQTLRFPSNISHFEKLCDLLDTQGHLIEAPDLYKLYCLCTNYCVEKIISGCDFQYKLYQLYRKIEENNLFLLEEYVEVSLLRNTINIALKVGEYDWTEYIIEKYKNKIIPHFRESIYNYGYAILSFYKKEYNETISYLSNIQTVNSVFDVGTKLILMKTYYEQDKHFSHHTEQVFRSFKAYIKQHRVLSKSRKEACINFANVLNNLYRIKHNEGKVTLDRVRTKIEQYDSIVEKYWLEQKISELAGTKRRRVGQN